MSQGRVNHMQEMIVVKKEAKGGERSDDEQEICEGRVKDKPGVLPEEGMQLTGSLRMDCAGNFSSSKITLRDM